MSEMVTESEYPIRGLWVFKSTFYFLTVPLALIFLSSKFATTGVCFSIALICLFLLITSALRRANFHYSLEDRFLTLRQGVFSKQQRHIPYGVIQDIFIQQDWYDKFSGLASLTVENASRGVGSCQAQTSGVEEFFRAAERVMGIGFIGNEVMIPGLRRQDAESLKEEIFRKIKTSPPRDAQSGL